MTADDIRRKVDEVRALVGQIERIRPLDWYRDSMCSMGLGVMPHRVQRQVATELVAFATNACDGNQDAVPWVLLAIALVLLHEQVKVADSISDGQIEELLEEDGL